MEEASSRAPKRPRVGDTVASAAAAAGEAQYQLIANASKDSGGRVWLFAVVAEIGAALKSNGTDESNPAGVSATFFAKDIAQLPHVKSTGDVISLHNVLIQKHNESDFFVTFMKNYSSFALFGSKASAAFSPYQTSTKYHGSAHDRKLLTQTRTWLLRLPKSSLGLKKLELHLRSLKSDSPFDLVCKVLHVRENDGKFIFYVWDGTDTPATELHVISDAEAERTPLHQEPPLPRDILCKMPCVGTVLSVFSDSSFKEVQHMQKDNCWARFCHITCKQEHGIWKGIFRSPNRGRLLSPEDEPSSRVRLLSPKDGSVVDCLKMFDSRNAKKRRPMTSFPPSNVTEVDVDCMEGGYTTLMESLTHDPVMHKIKTLVRVVTVDPCLDCEAHYIRLTLEDPTARIQACVREADLVTFFGCCPTKEVITEKLDKLLGVREAEDNSEVAPLTRNPPWIWCGLKSYYLDENDQWGSRMYQIYGTTIRD